MVFRTDIFQKLTLGAPEYSRSRACRLDFSIPMWPWWILSGISFRIKDGTRILSPLRMIPFSSDSSSLTSQYTWALELILAFVSGHPRLTISLRSCSDSSLAVSSWISSNFDYETDKLDCMRWTCCPISFSNVCSFNLLFQGVVYVIACLEVLSWLLSRFVFQCIVLLLHSQ